MGRREKGTGSVYQRKDGGWVAQYRGTYRYARTEKEAERKLTLLLGSSENPSGNTTVGRALDEYLQSAERKLKPRSVERYRQIVEQHIKPPLGAVRLDTLTALQVEDAYAECTPATAQLVHAVLSSALKREIRLGRLQTNVCSNAECPRMQRDEVVVFEPSEVHAMVLQAKHEPLEALWVLALTTGMRHGELLGLYVEDYQLERGTLAIRRTVYNGVVGTPKSKRSRRTIPNAARDALRRHTAGDTWMFENGAGNPLRNNTFVTRHWRPFLARAGVEYKNFHTCRHYVASTLLGKGLPITGVARYMGHDEQTLLSTYSHLMPDMMDMVAAAMDKALG